MRCSTVKQVRASRFSDGFRAFFNQTPHCPVYQGHISIHAHLLRKSLFHLMQPYEARGTHAAVFRFPVVVSGIRDPVFSADLFDLNASFAIVEHGDNLILRQNGSFSSEPPGVGSVPENSIFDMSAC
jgi:hypothetical protein